MKLLPRLACVVVALASLGAMEVSPQTAVAKTLQCLRANAPERLRVEQVELESLRPADGRTIRGRYLSRRDRDGLRALLHLTAPADLAGTRYLLVEGQPDDALYVYLPALGKTRRVSGAGPEADIAGTGLRFSDLRLLSQALQASSISGEGTVKIGARTAQVLRFVPAIVDSPFRRARVSVDEQTCVVLRAEFDRGEVPARRYEADVSSLTRSGDYHYASVATVHDLRSGEQVRIRLRGVDANAALPARAFDPRAFHR